VQAATEVWLAACDVAGDSGVRLKASRRLTVVLTGVDRDIAAIDSSPVWADDRVTQ
jgi:hypothetical protein